MKRAISLLCLLTWAVSVLAAPATLRFENISQHDQVAAIPSILSLLQDRQGFIWMGTQSGLARYDGYRLVVHTHDPANPHSIPGQFVSALQEDSRGRLWVGTLNGLSRFDPETEEFQRYAPEPDRKNAGQSNFVHLIESDGQDGLWLATDDGLQHFDPETGRFRILRHNPAQADSLVNDMVLALARDGRGGLWVGTGSGLDYLPSGASAFQHFRLDAPEHPDPTINRVQALRLDRRGALWIGTAGGIFAWPTNSDWSRRTRPGGASGQSPYGVKAIYEDQQANLWLASNGNGLLRWDAERQSFIAYQHHPGDPNSLPSNRASALLQDRSGTLWVGTWGKGVSRVDLGSGGFERFVYRADDPASLQPDGISSLAIESGKHLWVGGVKGLSLFDPASGKTLASFHQYPKKPDSLSNDFIYSLFREESGRLWVGTRAGLNRLDRPDGRFHVTHFDINSATDSIFQIARGRDGMLWLGTAGGLLHYDPNSGSVVKFAHDANDPNSLSNNRVTSILEDRAGRLWIGTFQGLNRLDPATSAFTHYRHDPKNPASLGNNVIACVFEDPQGALWVGTSHGLYRGTFSPDGILKFSAYTLKNGSEEGFDNNQIGDIQMDDAGQLWISTAAGLSQLDPKTGNTKAYFTHDGLIDNFVVKSSARSPDGTLFFGGFGGITAFRPEAVRTNPIPPQLAITDIQVLNRSLRSKPQMEGVTLNAASSDARTLTLPWQASVFSLEFSALHFADPGRNNYAYRLEGFDQDWVKTDAKHRIATYTNLDPGEYAFKVKASNKDGVWNATGATLTITITPPYWKTWWFRLLAAALLLGSAAIAYLWRVRTLMRQQLLLEHQVAARTAELMQQKEELHQANLALEKASLTDALTGLRNRHFLLQHLESDIAMTLRRYKNTAEEAAGTPPTDADLVFFLVDLDHFKAVNDQYGHAAGDKVLIEMRHRLEQVFRETDYLVRWGGEEFLVVARGTGQEEAAILAERIRTTVAEHHFVLQGDQSITQTCSVGFACFPFFRSQPRLLTWPQVVELADQGLYAAKHGGRNAWVGLYGATPTDREAIFRRLQEAPAEALRSGEIRVESSLPEQALKIWSAAP